MLTSNRIHHIGFRHLSMFEAFKTNLSQDFANDKNVQYYLTSLKREPIVRLSSSLLKSTNYLLKTSLSGVDQIVNVSLLPITYPLSKILKKNQPKLIECPFKAKKPISISGSGYLILRKNSFYDQFTLNLQNFGYDLETSRNVLIRDGYKLIKFVVLRPFSLRFSFHSKEHLVLQAIDKYFPTFNGPQFCKWMNQSFLPVLLSSYISGQTSKMKGIADFGIVQERQVQIADELVNHHIIKSRLLSISNVSIVEYNFQNGMPMLSVQCNADLVQHIVNSKGEDVVGSPENIKRAKMLVQMIINTDDQLPQWKAYEIRYVSINDRI